MWLVVPLPPRLSLFSCSPPTSLVLPLYSCLSLSRRVLRKDLKSEIKGRENRVFIFVVTTDPGERYLTRVSTGRSRVVSRETPRPITPEIRSNDVSTDGREDTLEPKDLKLVVDRNKGISLTKKKKIFFFHYYWVLMSQVYYCRL